jgi:hypothetical protein
MPVSGQWGRWCVRKRAVCAQVARDRWHDGSAIKKEGYTPYMAAPKQWTWHVMLGPHRMLTKRGDSGRQSVRHFEDEQSAREFARRMVRAGHTVQAGTKPGVEPAKKVLPAEVGAWCAEND